MATINLTKSEFLRKIADYENNPNEWKFLGNKPAVIDFYASWCGPCRVLLPILGELSDEYAGKVDIYKVNIDKEEELATLFNIRSVPTMFFIPMQGLPTKVMGVKPKEELKLRLDNLLK